MKTRSFEILTAILIIFMFTSCRNPIMNLKYEKPDAKIIFLHHSTGNNIWYGDIKQGLNLSLRKPMCMVPRLMKNYNEANNKKISIEQRYFPSGKPYPWANYPYDYYNIWVKNGGENTFMDEPTLEILTKEYDIIIFKHCFPVSHILEDDEHPDINSDKKTLANYKLQYNALKTKLQSFPKNKFIVWTGAALVETVTNTEEAERANHFFEWVKKEWDEPGDNIEIFDFREIETEGGVYLKEKYANSTSDSHPNMKLSKIAAELLVKKIVEVLEN
jgi:hypothetical protein